MAITLNNVGNVKFLRNGQVYANHNAAYNALTGFTVTDEQDGSAILARYTAEDTNVKTLVGWVYKNGASKYITIQDVEGASGDIAALLGGGVTTANTVTMQLTALSGNNESTSADTSVEGAKRYTDDKIDELKDSLEYTGVTTGDGKVIVNVTEADGIVSGATAEVGGLKLTNYSKGSSSAAVTTTDSINDAISKLENQIDAANDAIGTAIEDLDVTDESSAKTFVIKVDEEDGKVSTTKGTITSSGKTIVLTDNADGGVNFEANVDGITIVIDENTGVMSVASTALTQYEGDEDTIHISEAVEGVKTVSTLLTVQKVTTGLSADIKEEYRLVGASGNTIGAPIQIYKDSALLSVALLHAITTENPQVLPTYDKTNGWTDIAETAQTAANQALCYAYEDVSGNTIVAAVPVGSFINEQEFASGITWDTTANKVRGVVDGESESFLTVGENGFKLSGVQDAIDAAVGTAVSGLDATVSAETAHITVQIDEVDGKLSAVTLTEDGIASASDLEELSGKTITAITSTGGSISTAIDDAVGNKSVNIETDASKIKMAGFTAAESGFTAITSASTVTEAVKAIETAFLDNEEVVAGSLNDLNTRVDTVSGDVETISGKVETIEENYISGITVNGSGLTVTNNVAAMTIEAATSATTASSTEAITVDTDANGNITLGLAIIDCGTY